MSSYIRIIRCCSSVVPVVLHFVAILYASEHLSPGWNTRLSTLPGKPASVLDHWKRHNLKIDLRIWWHFMRRFGTWCRHPNLLKSCLGSVIVFSFLIERIVYIFCCPWFWLGFRATFWSCWEVFWGVCNAEDPEVIAADEKNKGFSMLVSQLDRQLGNSSRRLWAIIGECVWPSWPSIWVHQSISIHFRSMIGIFGIYNRNIYRWQSIIIWSFL